MGIFAVMSEMFHDPAMEYINKKLREQARLEVLKEVLDKITALELPFIKDSLQDPDILVLSDDTRAYLRGTGAVYRIVERLRNNG